MSSVANTRSTSGDACCTLGEGSTVSSITGAPLLHSSETIHHGGAAELPLLWIGASGWGIAVKRRNR
jgi:hypothetical protein